MDYIQEMITAALNGSAEAFNWLYRETYDRNYYIVIKMVKQEQDALDILQDTYVKVFQNLSSFRYNGSQSFAAWTGKIASNTALSFLRKKNPILFSDLQTEDEGDPREWEFMDETVEGQPELAFDKKETSQIVQDLLECLSEEQRICIILRYIRQMKISEIAQECACSENTVKSRLNYAKKRLIGEKENLEKKGVRLYNVAPFTLLVLLLKADVKAAGAPTVANALFAQTLDQAFYSPDAGTFYNTGSQANSVDSWENNGSNWGNSNSGFGNNSGNWGNPAQNPGGMVQGAGRAAAGTNAAAKVSAGKIAVIIAAAVIAAVAAGSGVGFAYYKMTEGNSHHEITEERKEKTQAGEEAGARDKKEQENETETGAKEETDLADEAMDAYKREVLDEIYYQILDGWEYDAYDPLYNVHSVSEAGYELVDLDGNGVPELAVSAVEQEKSGWFRDLYTYADGKVVHLMTSRARYPGYLCEGNKIYQESSSGAANNYWRYYSLASESGELIFEEGICYDELLDKTNPFFYVPKEGLLEMEYNQEEGYWAIFDETKMTPISEAEANSISNRFTILPLKLTTFEGYIPGVER